MTQGFGTQLDYIRAQPEAIGRLLSRTLQPEQTRHLRFGGLMIFMWFSCWRFNGLNANSPPDSPHLSPAFHTTPH